jgi:hypothetical protein
MKYIMIIIMLSFVGCAAQQHNCTPNSCQMPRREKVDRGGSDIMTPPRSKGSY